MFGFFYYQKNLASYNLRTLAPFKKKYLFYESSFFNYKGFLRNLEP